MKSKTGAARIQLIDCAAISRNSGSAETAASGATGADPDPWRFHRVEQSGGRWRDTDPPPSDAFDLIDPCVGQGRGQDESSGPSVGMILFIVLGSIGAALFLAHGIARIIEAAPK